MSIITGELPDSVTYKGEKYPVQTDFRHWIAFFDAAGKRDIAGMLRVYRVLPPSIEAAVRLSLGFGNGAALPYGGGGRKIVLDYETDGALIYAAFMGEYGIDLCEAELHWYKFCALLSGLGEERRLSKVMGIRGMEVGKISDKKRRKEIRELQRIYAIPDRRSAAERDGDIISCLTKFY